MSKKRKDQSIDDTTSKIRQQEVVAAILGDQVVSYHPMLAHAIGSVTAALFLSQLLYWHNIMERSASRKGKSWDGWFYKSWREMNDETGLSRKEQETARATLRRNKITEEDVRGVPATVHYKIDIAAINCLIEEQLVAQKGTSSCAKRYNWMRKKVQLDAQKGTTIHDTTSKAKQKNTHETTQQQQPVKTEIANDNIGEFAAAAIDNNIASFLKNTIGIVNETTLKRALSYVGEFHYTLPELQSLWNEIGRRNGIRNPTGLFVRILGDGQNPIAVNTESAVDGDASRQWREFLEGR